MERYIPVPQTRPKPPRAWLLFLQAGYKRAVLGTTILSNGKEHFGPTDRNDQTGQRGPPSKLVLNIPVGPNRNGPFHLMYQPKLPEFWVEWKAPQVFKIEGFVCKRFLPSLTPSPQLSFFWLLFHFSRGQNLEYRSSVFLCSETKRKRLLRRLY